MAADPGNGELWRRFVMFELEEESQISSIDLSAPDGEVRLEVRVGDSDDVEDAETVAEETADGDTTIELDEPATGSYVFLWYTQAAPEGGGYRVMVDEVEIGWAVRHGTAAPLDIGILL